MSGRRSLRRNDLAARSGLGAQSRSPEKRRDRHNRKAVVGIGRAFKRETLAARLNTLLDGPSAADASHTDDPQPGPSGHDVETEDGWVDEPPPPLPPPAPALLQVLVVHPSNKRASTVRAWDALLPRLERPFLQYRRETHGRVPPIIPEAVAHACGAACGAPYTLLVQCLYPTHFKTALPRIPTRPRTAVSIDLLDLYRSFFERSCDAITVLAAALHTTYTRRGLCVDSQRNLGMRAVDPFRAALSNAVLWSSNLQTHLDAQVSAALADAASALGLRSTAASTTPPSVPGSPPGEAPAQGAADTPNDSPPPREALAQGDADAASPPASDDSAPPVASSRASDSPPPPREQTIPALTPGRADRVLRERCPACFGLQTWGRPLQEGGDVQLGADGCFSYRHLESAGDGPISYTPDYFIPNEKMNKVRMRIAAARGAPAANYTPAMPQEVLNACKSSWEAANEKKQKADPQRYDASGVFALTCRHSQVLFLCNIDTPGEQQQYIIAALEAVQDHLPPQATILQTYDVGCITDHSCNLFPLLTPGLCARVAFAINAMHAYGHQWVCQLIYNPRMRPGCGLTDGEGVERIWSRIRKLIPLTRNQWNSRRIWMIDLYMSFVNAEGLANIGTWLERQEEKNLVPKLANARRMIRDCRVSLSELRSEWAAQKAAQSSVRTHAPARLKRELDKVLALQVQIDTVETSILEVKTSISGDDSAAAETHDILRRLQATHQALSDQAEALYASLNIADAFPELNRLPLEFVRTLLIMRDLKINIRKRAVGSFYEWETLDRAVSGRREALGTKLHQATRKAITRRQPALVRAIKKFNAYCARLEELRPPGCPIPIPAALPTTLDGLRSDPVLHQDVWIQSSSEPVPRWLEDYDANRLNLERANLDLWLTEELAVVARAIAAHDSDLHLPLVQRQQDLEYLRRLWAPALHPRAQHQRAQPQDNAASTTASVSMTHAAPSHSFAYSPSAPVALQPVPTAYPTRERWVGNKDEDDEDLFEGPHASAADTDIVASEELDPGLISDTDEPLLVEDMLERRQEIEETSGIKAIPWNLQWETLALTPDSPFLQELETHIRSVQIIRDRCRRQVPAPSGGRGDTIEIGDLDTLTTPYSRLNGFCLNGVAAALHAFFSRPDSPCRLEASNCAVLSTYDLQRIRYNASDTEVWRFVSRTMEEHWVLAVIPVYQRRVFLFDSLASKGGWRRDLMDIMTLVTRMLTLAERNHHPMNISVEEGAWEANPLFQPGRPHQTNGHDCDVWVLCTMAAFMRGYCSTSLLERDMGDVRRLLTDYIFTFPAR
ncbi:hypothetical protein B0H19DRAFT_1250090 [Mycena capillaripes]|nr:hypothetical protein B0H19DRAFT_1250090 [Mycena capillaripes]